MYCYRLGLDHLVGTPALKPYMHGYFVSLQLYDTARLIANPFAYVEHRERLVQDKLDKLAETRIRSRKDAGAGAAAVKVNKALAERVRKEEERAKKREERKAARKAKQATEDDQEDEVDDAEAEDAMEVDTDAEAPSAPAEKPTLLSDPRFTAVFEDPEFEVDEGSREFALLNPSAVAQRQNREQGRTTRRAKTAVEEEEDESDRASSDPLDESDEDESESGSGSEDSDDAGGQYRLLSS